MPGPLLKRSFFNGSMFVSMRRYVFHRDPFGLSQSLFGTPRDPCGPHTIIPFLGSLVIPMVPTIPVLECLGILGAFGKNQGDAGGTQKITIGASGWAW